MNFFARQGRKSRISSILTWKTRKRLPADQATEAKAVAAAQIRAMMAPDRDYAAMARYFVQVEWRLDVTTAEEQVETPARQP